MSPICRFTLSTMLALQAAVATAHHSHASLDPNDVRVLSGVVTRYSWSMPHVYLKVEAPNPAGELVEYSIELLHPGAMAEQGWSKDSFKPGDRITWQGQHDRNKARAYSSLEWAERDGVRIGGNAGAADAQVVPSTDFTGLWNRGPNQPTYFPPTGWPLTPKGAELVAQFSEDKNPVLECHDPGPPKSMTLPYAHRIRYADATTLIIERDLMEGQRVVHLDRMVPAGEPSKLGHSIGWFENGDLVVETSNFIADRWGTHTGIDSSEQKRVRERFRLSDGGLGIEIEITVTDPVYLSAPATFTHRWVKVAERDMVRAPCTMDSAKLWIEAGYGSEQGD